MRAAWKPRHALRATWKSPRHALPLCARTDAAPRGRRRWVLIPAAQRRRVSDAATTPLARDVNSLGVDIRRIEVVQRPGELLFVPSGWYHQARHSNGELSVIAASTATTFVASCTTTMTTTTTTTTGAQRGGHALDQPQLAQPCQRAVGAYAAHRGARRDTHTPSPSAVRPRCVREITAPSVSRARVFGV